MSGFAHLVGEPGGPPSPTGTAQLPPLEGQESWLALSSASALAQGDHGAARP
jgi:hypothetical protein